MKLEGKKAFVAKVLGVGKARVVFNTTRLSDVKESLTRQDIRDLVSQGAITVKEPQGRKQVQKRKLRRRVGSIKKRPINKKREYMTITRKLRAFIAHLKKQGKISDEKYQSLRKEIRARNFNNLAHLKENIGGQQ